MASGRTGLIFWRMLLSISAVSTYRGAVAALMEVFMIYYLLPFICLALIIFSGYKHYKQTHTRQLNRPRYR